MAALLEKTLGRNRHRFWLVLLALGICYAFYAGIRAPGGWMAHYFQISWFDGFLRRGLLGSLLYPFGCQRLDYFFVVPIIGAVQVSLLIWIIYSAIRFGAVPLATLFFFSPAGPYFFHWIGHPEQLTILLTALAIVCLRSQRLVWAALIASIAILIHEGSFFMILPIFVAYLVISGTLTKDNGIKLFSLPLGTLWVLTRIGGVSRPEVITRYMELYENCNQKLLRPEYLDIYRQTFSNRAIVYFGWHHVLWGILPLFVLAQVVIDFWIKPTNTRDRYILLACCLAPLLLGFLGWDVERWMFLTLCQIIFIGLMTRYIFPDRSLDLNKLAYPVLFCVLILFLVPYGFFDNLGPRSLSLENIAAFPEFLWGQFTTVPVW